MFLIIKKLKWVNKWWIEANYSKILILNQYILYYMQWVQLIHTSSLYTAITVYIVSCYRAIGIHLSMFPYRNNCVVSCYRAIGIHLSMFPYRNNCVVSCYWAIGIHLSMFPYRNNCVVSRYRTIGIHLSMFPYRNNCVVSCYWAIGIHLSMFLKTWRWLDTAITV